MSVLAIALALFVFWWGVGLATLSRVGAELQELRVALSAPVVGSAVVLVPLFMLSVAGAHTATVAVPVVAVVGVAGIAELVLRRPAIPVAALPVALLCLVDLVYVGRPAFTFGLHWLANANDDMAYYVTSAIQLLHHGMLGPTDFAGLARDRDWSTTAQFGHNAGTRPGSDVTLAALTALAHLRAYELFMPLILAMNLCALCGAAALSMQATRVWSAATLTALLLTLAPLQMFSTLQQLMPQVWGLAIATTLCAWLMRRPLHQRGRPPTADIFVVALLTFAIAAVYVELASTLVLAYLFYLAVILVRGGGIDRRAAAWLWGAPSAALLLGLNRYLGPETGYLRQQISHGTQANRTEFASLFGFTQRPSALASFFGLQTFQPPQNARYLQVTIAAGLVLGALVLGLAARLAWERVAAPAALILADALLGVFLGLNGGGFGLYKLFMWLQPSVAAVAAVSLVAGLPRWLRVGLAALLIPLFAVQISTANQYSARSRNPIDLRHASDPDLLPLFAHRFAAANRPVVFSTENPTLAKLAAMSNPSKPLHFVVAVTERSRVWRRGAFPLSSGARDPFYYDVLTNRLLERGDCRLALTTGLETVFNRSTLLTRRPLWIGPCGRPRNMLLFVVSAVGEAYYLPENRGAVSFYQLEPDLFFPSETFSGFGRYALFRVLGFQPGSRLVLDFTATLQRGRSDAIPPARVVGASSWRLPVVGRGAARVVSPPVKPLMINGAPYLLLDMGVPGKLGPTHSTFLDGLYGQNVPLDPRYLTSYVRNVSLLRPSAVSELHAPHVVARFPQGLANPNLLFSGISEDGWVGRRSYVVLGGGPTQTIDVEGELLPAAARVRVDVLVNGKSVAAEQATPGRIQLRARVPGSRGPRRVELRFGREMRLHPPDTRLASARLDRVGVFSPPAGVPNVHALAQPGLATLGVYSDGWLERRAALDVAAGAAGTLEIVGTVSVPRQRVDVVVDGRRVLDEAVSSGVVTLRAEVGSASGKRVRHIEFRFSHAPRISAGDRRHAAMRLTSLRIVQAAQAVPPARITSPHAFSDPALPVSGVYGDGWSRKTANLTMQGGPAATLSVHGRVLVPGQRVRLTVDGMALADRPLPPGPFDLSVRVPSTASSRQVRLNFSRAVPISPADARPAAALLESVSLSAP